MSWNIEKPGDRINGPLTITGNTTLTGTATISGDLTVDTSTLKVDAANNRVGVGTASPSAPLDVVGNAKISGDLVVDTNTLVVDSTNNRLGIGTASPAFSLDVSGDIRSTAVVRVGTTSGDTIDIFQVAGGGYVSQPGNRFLAFGTNNVERLRIDSSGNLGLGVTPKAWNSSNRAFQIGSYSSIADFLGYSQFANNFYNDGSDKFINAAAATRYFQVAGTHNWQRSTNASPTAGGAATMETSMTLDASGNLGVGVTTVGERIHASGNIKAAASAGNFPRFISEVGAKSWATGYRSGTTSFEIWEDSTTRLAIANGGQVRVGINGTASVPAIALAANPDTGLYWPTDADTIALAVGGSDAVYIDSSRRVGIGTNDFTYYSTALAAIKKDQAAITYLVLDNQQNNSSAGSGLLVGAYGGEWKVYVPQSATFANPFIFSFGSTERLRIKSTGQLRFVPLASDPGSAEAGDVYYNSATNKLRCYNGSAWNDLF